MEPRKILMRRIVFSIGLTLILIGVSFQAFGLQEMANKTEKPDNIIRSEFDVQRKGLACELCHYCPQPTKEAPCLRKCPRTLSYPDRDLKTSPEEGPEVVILDSLEHLFNPTTFSHKKHADMAQMSRGCVECHHYSPEGSYPACQECHKPGVPENNMNQVGLKGAYHRQCIGCHHEWSGENDCYLCHTSKLGDAEKTAPQIKEKSALKVVKAPSELELKTPAFMNSTVLVPHEMHVQDGGLRCQECHQGQGCLPCHDIGKLKGGKPLNAEKHSATTTCLACHADMSCSDCHSSDQDISDFDHSKTGFPLRSFHSSLDCGQCHATPERHKGAPKSCKSCHTQTFLEEKFDHKYAGFILSADHKEAACNDCHAPDNYQTKPTCSNCHDEEPSFPDFLPGEKIEK